MLRASCNPRRDDLLQLLQAQTWQGCVLGMSMTQQILRAIAWQMDDHIMTPVTALSSMLLAQPHPG